MDNLFNNILVNSGDGITVLSSVIAIIVALVFGLLIAGTYYITQEDETYQRSMSVSLLMLPVILSVVILFVGSNVARAFSLAGTLSIIRFRSTAGDAKDIGFIFFDIAAGLACGVGLYGYGALFVVILCLVIILAQKKNLFTRNSLIKILKITIPENLNYEGAFEDILEKYTDSHSLTKIKTTDLGSLFELSYTVKMKKSISEHDFLDEIRCRNGNLSIILSAFAKIQ